MPWKGIFEKSWKMSAHEAKQKLSIRLIRSKFKSCSNKLKLSIQSLLSLLIIKQIASFALWALIFLRFSKIPFLGIFQCQKAYCSCVAPCQVEICEKVTTLFRSSVFFQGGGKSRSLRVVYNLGGAYIRGGTYIRGGGRDRSSQASNI